MTSGNLSPSRPKITVIFLLYHAAKNVPALVEHLLKQRHPDFARQEDWLEAIFMDDKSRDDTVQVLRATLASHGSPSHYRVVANPENLGLSRTLNKAFGLASAPFGLTCHCDSFFGREDYVATLAKLMEEHAEAGAITGQPTIPPGRQLPLAEKVNLIANLMDVFPPPSDQELVPIGFAEGRCDVFRIEALAKVGFYETTLRLAGEDQVLAARLRQAGYEVYQAPRLPYFLSVSDEQDTLHKLLKHQRLFGRAHPYILLRSRGTRAGVVGRQAGANRRSRTLLRVQQMASVAFYAAFLAGVLLGAFPAWLWLAALGALVLVKYLLFQKHFRAVPLSLREYAVFFGLQPLLDLSYSLGVAQGIWLLARGSAHRPIS